MTPATAKVHGGTIRPSRSPRASNQPPSPASTCRGTRLAAAAVPIQATGSTTPWVAVGAETTASTLRSSIAWAIGPTWARWCASVGTTTGSTPSSWAARRKAGWAVSGSTIAGWRTSGRASRAARTVSSADSLPLPVTVPAASSGAPTRSRAKPSTSASCRARSGNASGCSASLRACAARVSAASASTSGRPGSWTCASIRRLLRGWPGPAPSCVADPDPINGVLMRPSPGAPHGSGPAASPVHQPRAATIGSAPGERAPRHGPIGPRARASRSSGPPTSGRPTSARQAARALRGVAAARVGADRLLAR